MIVKSVRPLIWEFSGIEIPKLPPLSDMKEIGYNHNRLRSRYQCSEINEAWKPVSDAVFDCIKNASSEEAKRLWLGFNKEIKPFGCGGVVVNVDKPTFRMFRHEDNHRVLGTVVINLVDNKNGTKFNGGLFRQREEYYTSPTERGTGIFFLNHSSTAHSIINTSEKDRITAYQNILIDSFFNGD